MGSPPAMPHAGSCPVTSRTRVTTATLCPAHARNRPVTGQRAACSGREPAGGVAPTDARAAAHWTSDDTNDKIQDLEGVAAAREARRTGPRPLPEFLAAHRRQLNPRGEGHRWSLLCSLDDQGDLRETGVEGTPTPDTWQRTSRRAVCLERQVSTKPRTKSLNWTHR